MMSTLDASEVAGLLDELGKRAALRGGNPYRARAYTKAAENLAALPAPLGEVIEQNRLRQVPGIGETIADIVTRLHQTGSHPLLEKTPPPIFLRDAHAWRWRRARSSDRS